jgi:D-tyrosyl-tRNA(Tyr) deacylase
MVSRVDTAAVVVRGAVVGEIGRGLLALVGVGREDDEAVARAMARKIHELRIFPGADGAVSA